MSRGFVIARQKLSRERIIEAAVELVGQHGVEGLSMRRLGRHLKVEAMSLYRYVSNKDEVLDGMQGAILKEMELPPPEGEWRQRLRGLAMAFWLVLNAHPRALPVFATRPATAPEALELVDTALAALKDAGFGGHQQLVALHSLIAYVLGFASFTLGWAGEDQGIPTTQDSGFDPERYPNLAELAPLIAESEQPRGFEEGLECLLEGFARRLPTADGADP